MDGNSGTATTPAAVDPKLHSVGKDEGHGKTTSDTKRHRAIAYGAARYVDAIARLGH